MSDQTGSWQPDPFGRHQYRFWNGAEWTDQVSNDGVISSDPATPSPEAPPSATPPPAEQSPFSQAYQQAAAAAATEAAPAKSKTPMVVAIVAVVALIAGGLFFIVNKDDDGEAAEETTTTTTEREGRDTPFTYGDDAVLDRLWDQCADGEMSSCDSLYFQADFNTEYEEFGDTCGNRREPGSFCTDSDGDDTPGLESGFTYGDNPVLDRMWDACEDGDMQACDDLYFASEFDSDYEEFADTCGRRQESGSFCIDRDGDVRGESGFREGHTYGDNPVLDRLWEGCAGGDMESCDNLYFESDFGTEYERFADTCGDRTSGGTYCAD